MDSTIGWFVCNNYKLTQTRKDSQWDTNWAESRKCNNEIVKKIIFRILEIKSNFNWGVGIWLNLCACAQWWNYKVIKSSRILLFMKHNFRKTHVKKGSMNHLMEYWEIIDCQNVKVSYLLTSISDIMNFVFISRFPFWDVGILFFCFVSKFINLGAIWILSWIFYFSVSLIVNSFKQNQIFMKIF